MRTILAFLFAGAIVSAAAASCGSPVAVVSTTTGWGGGNTNTGGSGSGGDPNISLDGGQDGATCAGATTCEKQGIECGPAGDGCGGILQCGDCTAPDTCGGVVPGKCGHTTCTPKTCAQLGADCGPVNDGCNGVIQCGDCTNGETCGGGGTPSVCGSGSSCTPKSCAAQAVNCGFVSDGCGKALDCGNCTGNQTCGGGGIDNVCGAPPCIAKTCQQLGADCGPVGDGCGGLIQCGTCGLPNTCGGQMPSKCGVPSSCTGLCLQQVSCSTPGVTTTVTGVVYAPNGLDPLPNAVVYVPNAPVQAFAQGVSCDQCGAPASGSPLVSAVTAIDGKFTLKNVPVGSNIPLVIQLGRWRRQVKIPSVAACTNTALPMSLTHLPKNQGEGDIPLMAFSTGAVDALECVMRKIGVDDTEFTAPSGTGRIHLYQGLTDHNSQNHTSTIWASGGAKANGSPFEDQLWSSQATLNKYDMVLFPCQADQADPSLRSAAVHQNLVNYANAGGRVFTTHFSYIWLYQTAPFSQTAQWKVEQHPSPANQTGYVNLAFPKGQALAQWLVNVGASTTLGEIPLQIIRHDHDNVVAPSQSWMTIDDDPNFPGAIVHYTFNTPVGAPAAQQCGRVLFDDFHVENTSFAPTIGALFPTECVAGAMTPQEKLLEFMIFDLASCVTPDIPTPCKPKTCTDLGIECGPAGDGCGGVIQCGSCTLPETCGGGGQPSQCGSPSCTPKTCQAQNIHCGPAGDGCGGLIQCGACPQGQTCGGGGMPGVCGSLACTPKTCAQLGIECGPAGDGCGNLIQCGDCMAPETCGGGGQPGVCGMQTCKPKTCAELGANCGPVGDGCGNVIQCGMCQAPQTCGGGGVASVCGGSGPQ